MPTFVVLRVQIEDCPVMQGFEPCVQAKFFPITSGPANLPLALYAPDETTAFKFAVKLFPYLRLYLAIEDYTQYERNREYLAKLRADRNASANSGNPNNPSFSPRRPNPRREVARLVPQG